MTKYIQRTKQVTLADGTIKRISGKGKTEKEALLKLAEKISQYEQGKLFICKSTPFKQWAEEWLEVYKKPQVKEKTFGCYKAILNIYFFPKIANIPINKLKPQHFQKCINDMTETCTTTYIKRAKECVSAIMRQALHEELVTRNVVDSVTMPKGKESKLRRALTQQERDLFLKVCETHPKALYFLISYYCGLRPAEVRALRWQDINLAKGIIKVEHSLDSKTDKLQPPKSNAGYREIPIPTELMRTLKKTPVAFDKTCFVLNNQKTPVSIGDYLYGFDSILRKMDLLNGAKTYRRQIIEATIDYDITPYYLRHTYCTRLAENGIDIKVAQYLMGHSTIQMTANVYTHITQKMLDTNLDRILAL